MGTQWCAFLGRAHANAAEGRASQRPFLTATLAVALGWLACASLTPFWAPAIAYADTQSDENAKLVESGEFDRLTAYEVQPVLPEGKPLRIGDRVALKVADFGEDLSALNFQSVATPQEMSEMGLELLEGPALGITRDGKLNVPAFIIRDATGGLVGRTSPFELNVESEKKPGEEAKPEPPLNPVALKLPLWVWIASILLGIALIFGGYLLYRRWKRNREKRSLETPIIQAPPKPEHEVALESLRLLEEAGHWRSGKYKLHYFALSEIFRRFLGDRFSIDALESTTREVMLQLEQVQALKPDELGALKSYLESLDRIKFTDQVPPLELGLESLSFARDWVVKHRRSLEAAEGPRAL